MKEINVLSTFNGMGCLWYALDRINVKVNKRYVSEIDKYANKSNDAAYPDSIHLGDVRNVDVSKLDKIDFFAGGSPCTDLSFAGTQSGLICNSLDEYMELRNEWLKTGNEDLYFHNGKFQESILFWEWLRILKDIQEINPDVLFFLENVRMTKQNERIINDALGLRPVIINSNLISAQNRLRYYWTNIKTIREDLFGDLITDIQQPKNKEILLKDIVEGEGVYVDREKSNAIISSIGRTTPREYFKKHQGQCVFVDRNKAHCIDANYYKGSNWHQYVKKSRRQLVIQFIKNDFLVRKLTVRECGRLQTFTDKELDLLLNAGISDTQLYKQFGNGWTVDAIAHILSFMK